jgi:peptide/nickel transport system substrate-binding protein
MTAQRHGHLVVAIPFDAQAFNESWRNYTGAGGYFVANNIFNRLVVLDVFGDGSIAPDLAERWDILDDGRRYVFHLNQSARWHDGVPVTAHDVAYTYTEAIANGYFALSWLQDIEAVRALDDHTVECILKSPNAAFLSQLGIFVATHILPRHLFDGTDWATNPHTFAPVGSGPFKFAEWVKGERIELVANDDYWGDGPHLERLTYRVIPDPAEVATLMERGEVHFYVMGAPCQEIAEWQTKPGVELMVDPGHALAFLSFNWTQPRWQDRRVREAIARVVDRGPLAAAACSMARPTPYHYLENITWAFNPDAAAPAHDLAAAERLLDEAGYPRDADGIRFRVRLVHRLLYAHYGSAARLFGEQLREVGIAATVEGLDPVAWRDRVQEAADFDLLVDSGDIGPDPQVMASFLTSDGPRNAMRYANPQIDALFVQGRAATDRAERGTHYRAIQAILADDIARVPLMRHGEHMPYRPEFTGWSWSEGVRGTLPFWSHQKVRLIR